MLIDSHCHLNYPGIVENLEFYLKEAKEAGVSAVQTISVTASDLPALKEISTTHSHILPIYCSVGIHPLHVADGPLITTAELLAMLQDPQVIGIGETGLDYYRCTDSTAIDHQRQSFAEHIKAAQESGLPLIIHTRDAEEDTIAMLRHHMAIQPFTGVIHCFTGSQNLATACIELGLYLSASGIITFKNAGDIRATFAALPLERFLIETDSPYLAPVPYRGKTNQPAYVAEVARSLAELKHIKYDEVCRVTTANFYSLFSKAHKIC